MRSSSIAVLCGAVLSVLALLPACGGGDDEGTGATGATNSGGGAGSPLNEAGATEQPGGAGDAAGGMSSGGSASGGTSAGGAPSGGAPSGGMSTGGASTAGSGGNGLYLPCESAADCKAFGGGKICCAMGTMHFCTKQSACSGDILP